MKTLDLNQIDVETFEVDSLEAYGPQRPIVSTDQVPFCDGTQYC